MAADRGALRAAAARWLALAACVRPRGAASDPADVVRFGFTVGKRQARRSVERALVKRVLREAARAAAPALRRSLGAAHALDVVLRLKAPFPARDALSLPSFKRALRAEADTLLTQLARTVARTAS